MHVVEFKGKRPRIAPGAFVAPTAVLIGDVVVEEGASIWFGAVLRGDFGSIKVGQNTSVQDNVVVHVQPAGKVDIGANVTVAHGAVLHNCTIEEGAIIGMNAVVLDNAVVGAQAMIAAGSVVSDGMQVPPRHLVAGAPAKPKKELTGNALWWVQQSARAYMHLMKAYLDEGTGVVKVEDK
ncbi:gamma carbonic anhydrase family protein [Desulfallas thermosapovorans]|uniref:Carbonic anhydrase/acetyltransferase-like protein (Isoleucine patch superfamily) n=1 Tax=Desulfallas thermosapovorans DSM 6562 TaxID=1121431 RepID=A0A5S4ZTM9_9FIRM|nr:gamma carbonic anhydrase family protein [Desulfallas thermosapovorans]TYO95553.1 carbonic anhydrase/acetyltransferase-like protein (isoleucine patch superfamily) [Desulfallas thermosapovorans DSM 6562]